jgi:hypothetical protein
VTLALSGNTAYPGIQSNTTLAGTGAVVFSRTAGSRRGIEGRGVGRTLTVNPQATIRGGHADLGASKLAGSTMTLVNNATISADVSGQSINITSAATMTNAGTAQAVGGGTLRPA